MRSVALYNDRGDDDFNISAELATWGVSPELEPYPMELCEFLDISTISLDMTDPGSAALDLTHELHMSNDSR